MGFGGAGEPLGGGDSDDSMETDAEVTAPAVAAFLEAAARHPVGRQRVLAMSFAVGSRCRPKAVTTSMAR